MTNVRQNLVRLLIGSAATVFFFWLFLQIAHLGDAWKEIKSLPGWAIGGALGFVLANVGFISLRWRYLFSAARYQTQARRLLPIFCVGAGANNVLPARGGDLLISSEPARGTKVRVRLLDGCFPARYFSDYGGVDPAFPRRSAWAAAALTRAPVSNPKDA